MKILYDRNIGCCGAVTLNRRDMHKPEEDLAVKKANCSTHPNEVHGIKSHNEQEVSMLTTVWEDQMLETRKADCSAGENKGPFFVTVIKIWNL